MSADRVQTSWLRYFFSAGTISNHARLGNGVNARGQNGCQVCLEGDAEGVAHRDPGLFHARRGQRGWADHIACRVNVGHRAALIRVHRHQAALVQSEGICS